jgi:hypothetical protein
LRACQTRCDLLLQDCPTGQGCYGSPCSRQGNCSTAGAGFQGASCTTQNDCAPGYGCVYRNDTTQCLRYCDLSSPSCPAATTCVELAGCSAPILGVCA